MCVYIYKEREMYSSSPRCVGWWLQRGGLARSDRGGHIYVFICLYVYAFIYIYTCTCVCASINTSLSSPRGIGWWT